MEKSYSGEAPLIQLVSFNKLLEHYDRQSKSDDKFLSELAKHVLEVQAPYPELREGFDDLSILEKRKDVIQTILADSFPPALTHNEIKAASIAFANVVFNSTKRFQKILQDAGEGFELQIQNLSDDMHYIMQCTVILGFYYGFKVDFRRPLFFDIPDANGVMRHYRILYNADFMELIPTENAKDLKQEDFDELLENFENIDLWKEKIPPNSFISKGFVISNMFDVTAEHSISEIKSTLIGSNKRGNDNFMESFQDTFRSLFNLKNIKVGFAGYDSNANTFFKIYGKGMESYILNGKEKEPCDAMLCEHSHGRLFNENKYFAIPNVEKYLALTKGAQPYKSLHEQGIQSAILAPIADNGNLLGVLELVSDRVNELNSINAHKLEDVMHYIVSAVLRSIEEEENLVDAIIQHECTTVHSSVYWKFQEEAKRFMAEELVGGQPVFKEIVFKDVYPLYGQVDIKESAKERNLAIQRDLMIQLSEINDILEEAVREHQLPIYEELMFRVNTYLDEVKDALYTHTEQSVFDFVKEEVNPILEHLKLYGEGKLNTLIEGYESKIDETTESYYDHRRNYDNSVMEANMKLAALLDKRQVEAQNMFPHYFERYKTDGVEHNMYIGSSIAHDRKFDELYLSNLRLWQLQVMCEMENKYYKLKHSLPVQLDVASLILVYSTSLSIRFRMDEKRFDVDGTYNARYEIIKKRIDKSYIKGSKERLTQKGKLAIVYSQRKEEKEYMRYVQFLKAKGYFTNNIEIVELEGLQGVNGLKAIRAEILYKKDQQSERSYTYDDLMEELRS
ncbi:MAG: GAF domain-containing protein [Allomuricauda sp.]